MNFTRKTYYGMCVVSAALAIIQSVFVAFNFSASAIGSVSMIFYGLAMLLIASVEKKDKLTLSLCIFSTVLLIVGLIPGFFRLGFFAWPCFAVHSVNHKSKNIQVSSKLVIGGGVALLLASFLSLPVLFATLFYLVINFLQIYYAYTLFKGEQN